MGNFISNRLLAKLVALNVEVFLSLVYTSGFRMHFPHCVAIFHKLPWLSETKVIYKKIAKQCGQLMRSMMRKPDV